MKKTIHLYDFVFFFSKFRVEYCVGVRGGDGRGRAHPLHHRQDHQQRRLVLHVGPVHRGLQTFYQRKYVNIGTIYKHMSLSINNIHLYLYVYTYVYLRYTSLA